MTIHIYFLSEKMYDRISRILLLTFFFSNQYLFLHISVVFHMLAITEQCNFQRKVYSVLSVLSFSSSKLKIPGVSWKIHPNPNVPTVCKIFSWI